MIKRGMLFLIISLQVALSVLKVEEENMKMGQVEVEFCNINEFTNLNYYLFCDTLLVTGPSDIENEYAILGNDICTIEEGKTAFQKFAGRYMEKSSTYFRYISSDCKWVITMEDVSEEYDNYMGRWRVFNEENKIMEMDREIRTMDSIIIIKEEEAYAVMDAKTNERLEELRHKLYLDGYEPNPVINKQGDLIAMAGFSNDKLVGIWNIKNETNVCFFSIESIQKNQSIKRRILQFWGDENEGKVIMQIGDRDFYEVSYPSGDMKYIGRDMYSLCYSPDGKYVAYSNCDLDDYYNFDEKDFDEVCAMPEGIYILEVETGRIAFVEQDSELDYQCRYLQWVEKESFNKTLEKDAIQMEEKP